MADTPLVMVSVCERGRTLDEEAGLTSVWAGSGTELCALRADWGNLGQTLGW